MTTFSAFWSMEAQFKNWRYWPFFLSTYPRRSRGRPSHQWLSRGHTHCPTLLAGSTTLLLSTLWAHKAYESVRKPWEGRRQRSVLLMYLKAGTVQTCTNCQVYHFVSGLWSITQLCSTTDLTKMYFCSTLILAPTPSTTTSSLGRPRHMVSSCPSWPHMSHGLSPGWVCLNSSLKRG